MKFRIPFVALGLLTLTCANAKAQDTVSGHATILPNAPTAQYTAGANGTAAVSGQSSHTAHYMNKAVADYMLLLTWNLSLNLGGQTASASGSVGQIIPQNGIWDLPANPTNLNAQGNFAPGVYDVNAYTDLSGTGNGLVLVPAGSGRQFTVVAKGTHGTGILVETTLEASLISVASD